tara:strand:- start:3835 stop:3960 length:126 start_codon:yes stop_codon:yes gene_type:complete
MYEPALFKAIHCTDDCAILLASIIINGEVLSDGVDGLEARL